MSKSRRSEKLDGLRKSFLTCPLAMAEAERFSPSFIDNIDNLMAKHGVSDEHIVMRVTGRPERLSSRCWRKWGWWVKHRVAENLHLGGKPWLGTRIPRMYKETSLSRKSCVA